MNQPIVHKFRKQLDSILNSDYYGLKNHGATCYLNSVLQVLFMTQDFREAVERSQHCDEDSSTIDAHLRCLFAGLEKCTANPQNIIEALGITNIYEQRDAAEYFERILNLTSPEASQIFKGQLRHRNTCTKCKRRTDSESFIWTLPLSIEDSRHQTFSVGNGLKAFFKSEKVSGDNKMYCDQCDKKTEVTIECKMTHLPEIVTLLLKRFRFDYSRMCYVKLNCCVDVPKTLTLEDCAYNLHAVVNHFGGLKGGHYTAEVRSYETGAWYHFSDASVKQSPFKSGGDTVRSSSAYLLMYRKETRRNSESINEADQEPHFANSDAVVGARHDMTERGKALNPHHHHKDDSHEGRQKLAKERGGDVSAKKRRREQSVGGELKEELEKQPKGDGGEAAAGVRSCEETVPHRDTGVTDAGTHGLERQKSKSMQRRSQNAVQRKVEHVKGTNVKLSREIPAGNAGNNCVTNQSEAESNIEAVNIKQGGEDNISVQMGNLDVTVQHLTRESQSQSLDTKKETLGSSSSSTSRTKPNSLKSNKKKVSPVMCLSCFLGNAQNVTKRANNTREKSKAKESTVNEKQPHWR